MAATRAPGGGEATINFDPEVERIFHDVADLEPKHRREYFEVHAVRDEIRHQVETLLARDEGSSHLLGEPVWRQVLDGLAGPAAGNQCGPYRLLKQIGQGGMGDVWLAERMDGLVKRPVAIKLPHTGILGKEFAQRFHRERDILASLAHGGIARLYDAGVADGERPFLVLEFIEGVALDRYCDERQLQLRARLSLFIQVLDAVQYAHSHLVIHSDLKPSNILVTDSGEAKLLDFGISRLIKSGETADNDQTLISGLAMTPAYAAPEQIAGQRVTTACDVYSLGILLFELFTGERPLLRKEDVNRAVERQGLEPGTLRPSQVATDAAKALRRGSTSKKLAAALKGDLDNITLKAIQWDPLKRYATVEAFKSDLERYLGGEPVLARPENAWYRLRKFILRHRLGVAAAASVSVALTAGLSVALWQSHVARREAQTSAAVKEFIQDIFETNSRDQPDPIKAQRTTARELLDIGVKKIDGRLNGSPAAKQEMLGILANLYFGLGLDDQAVALAKKRVSIAKKTFGESDPKVAEALTFLGNSMHSSSSVNEREAVLLEAQAILDRLGDFTSPKRGALLSALAEHYQSTDRKKGLEFGAEAVALYRKLPPSDELASALHHQGVIYDYNGESAKAEPLLAEALSVARKVGGNLEANLPIYSSTLGEANDTLMHFADAEEHLTLAWSTARALYGEDHENTIETEARLGNFLGDTSRFRAGLGHLQHAKDVCLKIKGVNDPFFTPQVFLMYGQVLWKSGRLEEGLGYTAQAVENRRKNRPGTRYLSQMLTQQARILADMGEDEKAGRLLEEADAIKRKVGFEGGSNVLKVRVALDLNSNKPNETMSLIESAYGPIQDNATLSWDLLANLHDRSELALLNNDPVTSGAMARRGFDLIEAKGLGKYLQVWEARYSLQEGEAYLLKRDPSQALPPLKRALQWESELYDPANPELAVTEAALGSCYLELGKRDESIKLLGQAESIRRMHKQLAKRYDRPIRELRERLQKAPK